MGASSTSSGGISSEQNQTGRLASIDILRGIAVLAVLVVHLPFGIRGFEKTGEAAVFPPEPFVSLAHYGEYGVHLFLIISGFCIHLSWAKRRDVTTRIDFVTFWQRRLKRLYPPYLVALVGSLLAILVFNGVLNRTEELHFAGYFGYATTSALLVDVVLLLLLLQNLNGASARVGNGPFWSLALEEQLYALYFPLLWLRKQHGWTAALLVAASVTLTWRLIGVIAFPDGPPVFWFVIGPAFWFAWALGALSVEQHFGIAKLPVWAASGWSFLAFTTIAVLLDPPKSFDFMPQVGAVLDDIAFCVAFFVLVNWWARLERENKFPNYQAFKWLGSIGVFSYSLYLTHMLVMVPLKQIMVTVGAPLELILLLRFTVPIVFGYVFYRLFERPAHLWARRSKAETSPV